jgi:anti-sigma regulatory factor (Ser/Thr protein kinase)
MAASVEIELALPRDASAAAIARRRIREQLDAVLDAQRLAELMLVISELVTNAVEHGQGAIRMRLVVVEGKVTGEVIDAGEGFEHQVREVGFDELRGRGLVLVEAITSRWGVHDGTTHVWFEIEPRSVDRPGPAIGQSERPPELPADP